MLVESQPVSGLVADAAEDPRRVVDEREVVEDAQNACVEVASAAERIDEAAEVVRGKGRSHGVDREVPPVEVLAEPRALDGRQRAGGVVELGPRGDDVDALAVAVRDDRGPELVVRRRTTAERPRERVGEGDRVSLDRDVDVEALLAEQDVPDRAADEIDAVGEIGGADDGVDDGCKTRHGAQLGCDLGRRLDEGRTSHPRAPGAGPCG